MVFSHPHTSFHYIYLCLLYNVYVYAITIIAVCYIISYFVTDIRDNLLKRYNY